ncbi:Heterokaryon incompatibility protein (HET) domain containing protein [Hyaloscypha variabilis]
MNSLVPSGVKRGMAGFPAPINPTTGDLIIAVDTEYEPPILVRVLSRTAVRFHEVTSKFVFEEGHPEMTIEFWKEWHQKFWEKSLDHVDTIFGNGDGKKVLNMIFEVVWPVPKPLTAESDSVKALLVLVERVTGLKVEAEQVKDVFEFGEGNRDENKKVKFVGCGGKEDGEDELPYTKRPKESGRLFDVHSQMDEQKTKRPAGPQCDALKLINGSRTNTAASSKDGGHQGNEPSNRQYLCEVCQGIKLQAPPYWQNEREGFSGQIIPHHPSYSMLLDSANFGCRFCIMIARALNSRSARGPDAITPEDQKIYLLWYRVEGSTYRKGGRDKTWGELEGSREKMGVWKGDPSRVPADYLVGTWLAGGPLHTIASEYILTRPHPLPDSDETFDLIQGWIQRCCVEHSEGNVLECSLRTKELLPTRIIDLEPANGTSVSVLKITNGESGAYVTLSHCWGKNLRTKLTTANVEQWRRGIDLSTLPQSFRDAIIVTQRLHIRYLWIDALCILQDSTQDWQVESSKMGSIYLNSFLTIAAANSADCHTGFLSQQPPTPPPCKLDFVSPTSESGEVFIAFYDEPEEPLDSRGWCLQEMLLGSRVLTYGTYQIFFECRQRYRISSTGTWKALPTTSIRSGARTIPGDIPNFPRDIKLGNPNSQKIRDVGGPRTLDEIKVALFLEWYAMIGSSEQRIDYSARGLTVPTDKLPAVSGLAHQVQAVVRSGYHAGLWADSIAYGLQWERCGLLQRAERWRSPSWSWASLDGPVEYTILSRL